jgi:hypothetical protein
MLLRASWEVFVLYRTYHLQRNPTTITYCNIKMKPEAGPPRVIDSPILPRDTRVKVTRLLGRCSRQLRKSCARASVMYSWAERVFILEHYFASKSFAAVREAFSNAYPDKEVPNKTIVHRLVTKFRDTGSVCLWQVLIERHNSWNYGRTDFKQYISCNNGLWLQEFNIAIGFVVLWVKGFSCGR